MRRVPVISSNIAEIGYNESSPNLGDPIQKRQCLSLLWRAGSSASWFNECCLSRPIFAPRDYGEIPVHTDIMFIIEQGTNRQNFGIYLAAFRSRTGQQNFLFYLLKN